MGLGTHHRHLRSRLYRNLEQFPHSKRSVRILDAIVYVAGFLGPAFTLPQIYLVYVVGNIEGISIITWGAYALLNIPWIFYGLVHREPVITFTYTLWFVVNTAVVVGVLLR